MIKLKDIKLTTKTAHVDFPGIEGFVVEVAAISRELSRKIKKESEIRKLDPQYGTPTVELDENLFVRKFASHAVKGWKGLKYRDLPELMLVDLSSLSEEDLDSEVPYNEENAEMLVKDSQGFDSWLNSLVFSLQSFRS